ncbi:hypothetical protein, partial [Bifidobacterium vespertilionis]|uniref:hypothetical protein n=1 Tax=Bifidobacterium vespertilionis TaxID=2562524 RepID=UPI001CC2F614
MNEWLTAQGDMVLFRHPERSEGSFVISHRGMVQEVKDPSTPLRCAQDDGKPSPAIIRAIAAGGDGSVCEDAHEV